MSSLPKQNFRSRGVFAELTKAEHDHKDAELELKRLECKVQQLSSSDSHDANRNRLLMEAAARHEEVRRLKDLGRAELKQRQEIRQRTVRQLHEREESRRRAARSAMQRLFTAKLDEVSEVKQRWQQSLNAHYSEDAEWTAQLKDHAKNERNAAGQRRLRLVETLQEARAQQREEVLRTSQSILDFKRSLSDETRLRERAREQRERDKESVRRARATIEARNTQDRISLISRLTDVRAAEISRIRERMAALAAEEARLKNQNSSVV